MIRKYQEKDLKAKKINPELVLAEPIKKPKLKHEMTDLEVLKEDRAVMSGEKVSREIYAAVIKASTYCPRLF